MRFKLILDYIAVCIYAVILISMIYRKMTKGLENRIFFWVVMLSAFTACMDILMGTSYSLFPKYSWAPIISYIFAYGYFLSRQYMMAGYIVLIFVQSDTGFKLKKKLYNYLLSVPVIIASILILSNIFTHKVFTITLEETYKRGPWMVPLYVISFMYGLFGFVYLSKMRRYIGNPKWLTMESTYIALIGSVIFQIFYTEVLIEMVTTAFTLLLVHIIVYRSEEIYDSDTGLFNTSALEKQLNCLTLSKREATLLLINLTNAPDARKYFGDEKFFGFIKKVADEIGRTIGTINGYKVFYQSAGNIQVVITQGKTDIEREFPKLLNMWKDYRSDSYVGVLRPKLCIVDFPDDFSNGEALIQFSRFFQQYMKPEQNELFARDVNKTDTFRIQENISEIISRGLENKNFEMFFQPIYDVKNERYTSAEALIRFKDEEYGFISPGLFIPAAERTGLILPIGDFVIDSVFKFVTNTNFDKLGLRYIELNLSVEQLLQDNFTQRIEDIQEKYGTLGERINLEITESMAGMLSGTGSNNVEVLIRKHFTFALDDYGTGYSNIKRALTLPLSLVKIDKSIIDIVETPTGESIVRNTIIMMHDAGFKIVCEGVETETQYRILKELDCDYIQGYYFAKPMNAQQFVEFIKEKNQCTTTA